MPEDQQQVIVPVHQRVQIAKANGSLQCNQGKTISLEKMAEELKGIPVYSQKTLNDGLMRIQVCGSPTGDSNVYEIPKDQIETALKRGFTQWNSQAHP